ncbi:beta-ketoacyl synthase N-terminal-like domain-containing protein, partial [Streptomyces boncukensis]
MLDTPHARDIPGAPHHDGAPHGRDRLAGRRGRALVTAQDAALRDHLVHGVPVLPGVFLLELVLRLVRDAGVDPATAELRRCRFLAPVTEPGAAGHRVEVLLGEPDGGGALPVTIRGRAESTESAEGAWRTHCTAELHLGRPRPQERVDPGALADRAGPGTDADELYALVRRIDIEHRDFMKAHGTVYAGPGFALAELSLADSARAHLPHFLAHPAALDFATLVPLWLLAPGRREAADHAFLPISIDSFRAAEGIGAHGWVHVPGPVSGGLDSETMRSDIRVCDGEGNVVAALTGFRAKRVRTAGDLTGDGTAGHGGTPQAPEPGEHGGHGEPGGHGRSGAAPVGEVVTEVVAAALGIPPGDLDPDRGFYDHGLTSVSLLSLADTLEQRLGRELYPTLLFEHPTARALAAHLRDQEPVPQEPLPSAPAPSVSRVRERSAAPAQDGPPGPGPDAVAITGLAGRFPGAPDTGSLWRLLAEGRDALSDVPPNRWDAARHYDPAPGTPGRTYTTRGAFLDGVDRFDAPFFRFTDRQAELADPHERLFLETAWQVLEDAGHTPAGLAAQTDGEVGVFAGVMWNDYQLYGADAAPGGGPAAGSWFSAVPNRVSHLCDFSGPSLAVDAACSSSLAALHLAAESIRRGECRAALAGGVNLSLHPYKFVRLAQLRLLSADGRCRPFAAGADGYVPGEGVGAVLLRPLGDALASGDRVHAVLRGSSLRHSGRTSGFAVPHPEAQERVVAEALDRSGVPAGTVGYLEAHGSATALGDRMEFDALRAVFGERTDRREFCALGSVKHALGHLEAAAGVAGLVKILLCMRHGRLVPSLGDGAAELSVDFADSPFRPARLLEPWPEQTDPATDAPVPRRAGLSTFGAGGANVHMVLEQYREPEPEPESRAAAPSGPAGPEVVQLSARTPAALRERARRLRDAVRQDAPPRLTDVVHTLRTGREAMRHRLALVVRDADELAEALETVAEGGTPRVPVRFGEAGPAADAPGTGPAAPASSPDALAEAWTKGAPVSWPAPAPDVRR